MGSAHATGCGRSGRRAADDDASCDNRDVRHTEMSEKPYNPDDLAFLISRSLDEDLTEDEQRRLDRVLEESETLRLEADRLCAVDRLVKRWGARPVELDWEPFAAPGRARAVAGDDDDDLHKIDDWLRRWGDRRVAIDEERFAEAVMTRIGASARRSFPYGLVF